MRVLIDTNILIHRENHKILSENLQKLMEILHVAGISLLIHPISEEELQKDKDIDRKNIVLSKLRAYPKLKSPLNPKDDKNYLASVGSPTKINDELDNFILYAVYKNAVDFLITEDVGIIKKAKKIDLSDRVLAIEDALIVFSKYNKRVRIFTPPAIKHEYVYNLNQDDIIFDSLRSDYPEFNDWFQRISKKGRECWVYYPKSNEIGGVLIFKNEDEAIDSNPPLPKKNRLKICLMKVSTTV